MMNHDCYLLIKQCKTRDSLHELRLRGNMAAKNRNQSFLSNWVRLLINSNGWLYILNLFTLKNKMLNKYVQSYLISVDVPIYFTDWVT